MSRARTAKKDQRMDFLDANPELTRSTTEFRPDEPGAFANFGTTVSVNGGTEFSAGIQSNGVFGTAFFDDPAGTTVDFAFSSSFSAYGAGSERLTISDTGFGVISNEERSNPDADGYGSVDFGEQLGVNVRKPGGLDPEEIGFTEISFHYSGTGNGTVIIFLDDTDPDNADVTQEFEVRGGARGVTEGTLTVEDLGGIPDRALFIPADPSLELSITGVSFGTNIYADEYFI